MEWLRRTGAQIDAVVYRVERALLLLCLTLMTVLVTLDVVQRTFSRPVGRLEGLLLSVLYAAPDAQQQAFVVEVLGPALFGLFALVGLALAAHSSRSLAADRSKAKAPSALIGLGLLVALTVGVKALLFVFPSSVPGAQKFSLGLMLWSGLLGASLATRSRRHIILDPIKKKLDAQTLRPFALLGGVATFIFCAFIAALGVQQMREQIADWSGGGGAGVYDALPIPLWVTTLSIPVTFGVMALRFLAQGIGDFVWGPPSAGVDAHGIDLEELAKEPSPLSGEAS